MVEVLSSFFSSPEKNIVYVQSSVYQLSSEYNIYIYINYVHTCDK